MEKDQKTSEKDQIRAKNLTWTKEEIKHFRKQNQYQNFRIGCMQFMIFVMLILVIIDFIIQNT